MLFIHTLVPDIRRHAALFQAEAPVPGYAQTIGTALRILADQAATYDAVCDLCISQTRFFEPLIRQPAIGEDDAFVLLEDALLFIREKTLRTATSRTTREERDLVAWVEAGDVWTPADGTLFSRNFFYIIPLAVLETIVEQMGPVARFRSVAPNA